MESTRKAKGTKRPRSATPSKGGSPPKKKNKKSKKNRSSGGEPTTKTKQTKTSLDEPGQLMAQMLSTFSLMEQSRFEAYKRATLPATAVQNWIAACLVHRLATPIVNAPPNNLDPSGAHTKTNSAQPHHRRPLSDLVVPASHDEIGLVVATAAKIYAQRLVAAAVQVRAKQQQQQQSQQQQQQQQSQLQPEHVWQALQERQQSGLDPGFYMQPNEERYQFIGNSTTDEHAQRRLAALEAQEAYDKLLGISSSEGEDSDGNDNNKGENGAKEAAMEGVAPA